MKRQLFLASSLGALGLTACGPVKATLTQNLHDTLESAESLNHAVIGTRGMAKLYRDSDIDHDFRTNGLDTPSDARYKAASADDFRGYTLPVTGLVDREHAFSIAELRAMALQTQITRHDCVEGWSAIGKWRGVPLATVVAMAQPKTTARYVVFRCFDADSSGTEYYESLSLHEAAHPQTLLALDLNDAPLDHDHGAPVRLRVPTQLGYKSAKWVRGIEIAAEFPKTLLGKGGYWEDQGYEWYAGI